MSKTFEVGKTYPSRDGTREYNVVAKFGSDRLLVTWSMRGGMVGYIDICANGCYKLAVTDLDMVFPKVKKSAWINMYRGSPGPTLYPTEKAAKKAARLDAIATIRIEWEEEA